MQTVRANALAGDPRAPVSALALRRALALTSVTLTPVDLPSVGVVLALEHVNSKYPPYGHAGLLAHFVQMANKKMGEAGLTPQTSPYVQQAPPPMASYLLLMAPPSSPPPTALTPVHLHQ